MILILRVVFIGVVCLSALLRLNFDLAIVGFIVSVVWVLMFGLCGNTYACFCFRLIFGFDLSVVIWLVLIVRLFSWCCKFVVVYYCVRFAMAFVCYLFGSVVDA